MQTAELSSKILAKITSFIPILNPVQQKRFGGTHHYANAHLIIYL